MTVRVQTQDFDIRAEVEQLAAGRADIGAIVTFTGTVRGEAKGKPIASMLLEHYPGMTEVELERVEAEAHRRWSLQGSTIIHRHGELKPGDNIVLVVTASSHRQVQRPVLEEGDAGRGRKPLGRCARERRGCAGTLARRKRWLGGLPHVTLGPGRAQELTRHTVMITLARACPG